MFKAFYVIQYFFFDSGDYYKRILNLHLLYKRIKTYIHKRLGYVKTMSTLCKFYLNSS